MTLTLEDGFKMLKKPDRLNPDPKQRMYFWYGHEQALLLDKTKVSATDIKTALASEPPKPPFCYGRLALHDGKQGGQEIRVAVAGAIPSKLAKDLKAEAAKHGLRGVDVVVDDGLDEEGEAVAHDAADVASNANRLKLAEAVKGLLAKKPQLRDAVTTWLETATANPTKARRSLSWCAQRWPPSPRRRCRRRSGSSMRSTRCGTRPSSRARAAAAEAMLKGLDTKTAATLRKARDTRDEAEASAKSLEDARQVLHAALGRLGRAIKDRAATSSKV